MSAGDTHFSFTLQGAALQARASGILWWADQRALCVSDLHLGKSLRPAKHGGAALPPFEVIDTVQRLEAEIAALSPQTVICLGDSFDDATASAELPRAIQTQLHRLQAGRRWIWIEGNHDPGPVALPGSHMGSLAMGPLVFRHIATPPGMGEISGHYHPKATVPTRARPVTRPCFLLDQTRVILPAFGTYTGGLASSHPALAGLMGPQALAVLTGARALALPMPR
jgi:DNA ligase-associated metallophosphoesterase